MLRFVAFLLASITCGALASSSIVDVQEQFGDFSHGVEIELQEYRARYHQDRAEVIHRMLGGLGKVNVELRDITVDYWAQIVAHEYATPECLDLVRPEFEYFTGYGARDLRFMAIEFNWFLERDAVERFNLDAKRAQRENSQAIYRTVQTLGQNQFLDNMVDTVNELQDQLESTQSSWMGLREILNQDLDEIDDRRDFVEGRIEFWHEFAVRWHRVFLGYQVIRIDYVCKPEEVGVKDVGVRSSETIRVKMEEMRTGLLLKTLRKYATSDLENRM